MTSRPVFERPESVTHWTCPEGEQATRREGTTHHILTTSRCRYCHKLTSVLRAEQRRLSDAL